MDNNDEARKSASTALADLLAYIVERAPHKYGGTLAQPEKLADAPAGAKAVIRLDRMLTGETLEIEYFHKTWEKFNTSLRLEQAQSQVPANAGPLNSSQLVYRALLQMQDRSPGYLRHFLSYVDTLSWMEEMAATGRAKTMKSSKAIKSRRPASVSDSQKSG